MSHTKENKTYSSTSSSPIYSKKKIHQSNKNNGHCSSSVQTLSIHNLVFPEDDIFSKRALQRISCKKDLLQRPQMAFKSTSSSSKERGFDFTSSTNSHFENIFTVPRKHRENFQVDPSNNSATTNELSSSLLTLSKFPQSSDNLTISQELMDNQHDKSEKTKFIKAIKTSTKTNVIHSSSDKYIHNSAPNIEQIAKMSKVRQKFFITQDPRKLKSLVNTKKSAALENTKQGKLQSAVNKVAQAQNISTATLSDCSQSYICEVLDLENPLQLDFQGLDYKNTYQNDEQDLQNQRQYRMVERFMDRKRVKAETKRNIEKELHQKRVEIPACFEINDRDTSPKVQVAEQSPKICQLFRSVNKPLNQYILNMEKANRKERYKALYLKKKDYQDQQRAIEKQIEKERKDKQGLLAAEEHFDKVAADVNDNIRKTLKKEQLLEQPSIQQRKFPHTLRETNVFRKELKHINQKLRSEARIKQEFYRENLGKEKLYPEAELDLSSDTTQHSSNVNELSEQSTDDEDTMKVGKDGSQFKLRGFQYKLDKNMRGETHQRDHQYASRKQKGCITRDQWLKQLEPKKLNFNTGDRQLSLFNPKTGLSFSKQEQSAIKEFKLKPLGRHYDRLLRKSLKFAKPRLRYSVKKFSLIGYLFGNKAKRLVPIEQTSLPTELNQLKLETTSEYIQETALKRQQLKQEIKQKRLELLGLPSKTNTKSVLEKNCEYSSSSSDSEWLPEREANVEQNDNKASLKQIMPFSRRSNMPAPKYREPTIRQHPRRPREYENQRIPSEMFDNVIQTTAHPYMDKLQEEKINYANLSLKKRPYTDMLELRHHHDHRNPTEETTINVHYQPIVVRPEITKTNQISKRNEAVQITANPPCNEFVDKNLTLPQWNTNEILQSFKETLKNEPHNGTEALKIKDNCKQHDLILRTRDPIELNAAEYPGRQNYMEFLHEIKKTFKDGKENKTASEKLYVNKSLLQKQLEDDLHSIESCLTSLSSSRCTNLSNDSGSFLLLEGTEKIPLDFLRKSVVPFDELQRSRFRYEPIDVEKEADNPFRVLTFCGQRTAQLELTKPKDSFFTSTTRLKNGLRLRLEVPVEDVREKFIGTASNKHTCLVAIDNDEHYVAELKKRPFVKMFNFKSGCLRIKDALRLKFESRVIQNQMNCLKFYDDINENYWSKMKQLKVMFEQLFSKWEKMEYDVSMAEVRKTKSLFEETDQLKAELKTLERDEILLNMDIVFIEAHWIRCLKLQNFNYLLGDYEWRLEHDWIHRISSSSISDTKLQNLEDSIVNRSKVNIRQSNRDDAWAIKDFYEEVYLPNKHANLIVFPNAESFLQGLENLKTKTFLLLVEMHFTLAIHTELQGQLETLKEYCEKNLKMKHEFVDRKCGKLYFMQYRSDWLGCRTLACLDKPIAESFNDEVFLKDLAVISEAWRRIVPDNMRGSTKQLQPVTMVGMMSDIVVELIAEFETIPMAESHSIENKLRVHRNFLRRQSYHAYRVEQRIGKEMKKVVKNLEPPYQKLKRPTKSTKYRIKKQTKSIEIPKKKISERAKLFYTAFHDDINIVDVMPIAEIRDSITQIEEVHEQIAPFYFDHFLKLNGYTPNYNFKTHVELRDGPELERMKVRSVIPEIQERMLQWEITKKKIMEYHIAKNPRMYVNVV